MISFKPFLTALLLTFAYFPSSFNGNQDLNLPAAHVPYYFQLFDGEFIRCLADPGCPYKVSWVRLRGLEKSSDPMPYRVSMWAVTVPTHDCFQNLTESPLPCWGYEDGCQIENSFMQPNCPGDHKGWVRSKREQLATFYSQADFGYVRAHRDSVQVMCEPTFRVSFRRSLPHYSPLGK